MNRGGRALGGRNRGRGRGEGHGRGSGGPGGVIPDGVDGQQAGEIPAVNGPAVTGAAANGLQDDGPHVTRIAIEERLGSAPPATAPIVSLQNQNGVAPANGTQPLAPRPPPPAPRPRRFLPPPYGFRVAGGAAGGGGRGVGALDGRGRGGVSGRGGAAGGRGGGFGRGVIPAHMSIDALLASEARRVMPVLHPQRENGALW